MIESNKTPPTQSVPLWKYDGIPVELCIMNRLVEIMESESDDLGFS